MELKKMSGGMSVDTDELTAVPEKVLESETFLGNGNDEAQTGTMPDMSYAKGSPTISTNEGNVPAHRAARITAGKNSDGEMQVAMSPPKGFFPGDGMAFICCRPEELGIDPENIPVGKSICLIEGSWGADADFAAEDLREGKVAYGTKGRVIGMGANRGTLSKTLAAGEEYTVEKGFVDRIKVTAKDLRSQTVGNATDEQILSGKVAWVDGKKVVGKMPDRGSSQVARKAYFYKHSNGVWYLVSWMPGGHYNGWQPGDGVACGEVWTDKNTVDNLIGRACISAVSARGFRASGGPTGAEEQSFTMPRDGTVYYGGCTASYGTRNTICEIYKNGAVVDSRNIDNSNDYAWRTTMFNRSFKAKAGEVIKVKAYCAAGAHAISSIQAVIIY